MAIVVPDIGHEIAQSRMELDPQHLAQFRADLSVRTTAEMYERYVARELCAGLEYDQQLAIRNRIAAHFGTTPTNIVIVGSAKLGFTLRDKDMDSPDEARPRFSPFSENSDIDVAIVADSLFDDLWKRCFEFWRTSGYAYAGGYWPRGRNFRDYIFRGWMRPDHLPSEGEFTYKNEWFDFFRNLANERVAGDYKVTGGLYREAYFLQAYQYRGLEECRQREMMNV